MPASEQKDLTGVWDGLSSYPRAYQPTPFTTAILQVGSAISGSTHEVCNNGRWGGRHLSAVIVGARSGDAVRFIKTYEAEGYNRRPVTYEGALSADGVEIEGTWTVLGSWSGKFLMIRSGRNGVAAEERRREKVPQC